MKRIALVIAAVAATAAPAFANDQLSAAAGVEPGVLNTAQLVDLLQAQSDDNHIRVAQILRGVSTTVSSSN